MQFKAPQFELDGWVSSYSAIAVGEFEVLSDTVERFTGRAPMSLKAYLAMRDYSRQGAVH
uniref:hypothetical protein n=1 Tax=Marinobacterium profundum TaxID=1714300 RepID=UPI000833C3AA|nr:hypothetical protein [Marinobacterium profundum]